MTPTRSILKVSTFVVVLLLADEPVLRAQANRDARSLVRRIRQDDANKDGEVTRAEFKGPAALFQRLDRNNDGKLSKEELDQFAQVTGEAPAAKSAPKAPTKGAAQPLPAGTRVLRDIAYVPDGHERQKLDLYLPEQGTNLPLVVWIHGGGWQNGSKDRCPATRLLSRGYAVASLNYRLSQHATFPAQIEDCKAGIRWLRANARANGIDPERIAVWGSSAGGHLVAMLGVTGDVKDYDRGPNANVSSRVQAVVDFFGPTELATMQAQTVIKGPINHDAPDSPEAKLIGGPVQENKARAAKASPISYVSAGDAPILILHGDQDPLVPLKQSEVFLEKLKAARVDATLHVVPGAGHGFSGTEIDEQVNRFLDRILKPAGR